MTLEGGEWKRSVPTWPPQGHWGGGVRAQGTAHRPVQEPSLLRRETGTVGKHLRGEVAGALDTVLLPAENGGGLQPSEEGLEEDGAAVAEEPGRLLFAEG